MAKPQEVERIAKKLDKMVHVKDTSTRVGMSVNAVRKHSSDEEVQTLAKALIKSWKKLLDGSVEKTDEKEKKKEGSPVRSSSSSKDSGSSEKSCMKSGESLSSPSVPTAATAPPSPTTSTPPPQMASFPPAPVTTHGVRNKCRELLVAALQTDDDHKTIGVHCENLAAQIEEEIFQEFKTTDIKYKTRLRSRISNLKDQKNPDLRRNVLCGNISAQRIASMTAEEMASAELKQKRQDLTKESIREHQLSKVGGTETDMFICSKCHGKNCSYTQVQIRSADEPMTTFVLCNNCGNRWKFC
ncbi:transcription elongation factor A protein 2 isoform 3-T5 [Spinachia spinachia]